MWFNTQEVLQIAWNYDIQVIEYLKMRPKLVFQKRIVPVIFLHLEKDSE